MIGYFKVYRKMLENPLASKPNYLAVWMYLLIMANYEDRSVIWNNEKRVISRGSFIGSIDKIARHFKLSKSTVSRILDYLQRDGMIVKKSNPHFTEFIITNYDFYQKRNAALEHEGGGEISDYKQQFDGKEEKRNANVGNQDNTDGTQAETTKKYKKDKKLRINTFAIENLPEELSGECFIKTKYFFVTQALITEFREKLSLTISDEALKNNFYKMEVWLESNGSKKNYKTFFVNWLTRAEQTSLKNQPISKPEFHHSPLIQQLLNKSKELPNGQA